jgi:hypothetical protein
MPSTLTVTSPNDANGYYPGYLRYEIQVAKSGDTIVIDPSLSGQTIQLGDELFIDKSLTIQNLGAQNVSLSGQGFTRVFEIKSGVQVTLAGLTIEDGSANYNFTREVPRIYGTDGGGILNLGALTLSNCTLFNNRAYSGNDLVSVYGGGGIYNVGTLTVSNSSFRSNHSNGWSGTSLGYGGAICNTVGYLGSRGTATLTNCTLAINSAAGDGGALYVRGGATLTNCTISGNTAGYGGGIFVSPRGILNLTNTIVAQNSGADPDIYGAVATADHNLVGDATGSTGIVNGVNGNIVGGNGHPVINANLGPLQNNGGPTQTMALLPGSLAIGHGNNAKAPATDQRGVARLDVAGELADIGAFEL